MRTPKTAPTGCVSAAISAALRRGLRLRSNSHAHAALRARVSAGSVAFVPLLSPRHQRSPARERAEVKHGVACLQVHGARPNLALKRSTNGRPPGPVRSGGTVYIFTGPGLASCRWRPLSLYVRRCPMWPTKMKSEQPFRGRQPPLQLVRPARLALAQARHRPAAGTGKHLWSTIQNDAVTSCGSLSSAPRSNSGHRRSWFVSRLSFGGCAVRHHCGFVRAAPNPALKRTPIGMSAWPSSAGPAAHFALAVQPATPLGAA